MTVSVVIPNWNGRRYIERCLNSVARQTYQDFDVWVVDNGSTDGSDSIVAERYRSVHLVKMQRNLGFAAAVNRGITESRGEILCLLNMDTECDPHWIAALVDAFQTHPDAGSCASLILEMKDRVRIGSAGDYVTLSGTAGNRWQNEPLEQHSELKPEWVFGPSGAAAAYRRSALNEVGPFEESFFSYFEDVDMAFRLQRAGLRSLFVPDAVVWHLGHSTISGPDRRAWAVMISHRNQIWMIARNLPGPIWRRHWKDIVRAQLRSIASAFIHFGSGPPLAVLKGKFLGLLGLPRCLRYRSASLKQHPGGDIGKMLLPPIAYRGFGAAVRRIVKQSGLQYETH